MCPVWTVKENQTYFASWNQKILWYIEPTNHDPHPPIPSLHFTKNDMSWHCIGRQGKVSHIKINTVCNISLLEFNTWNYCSYNGMKPLLKQLGYLASTIRFLLLFCGLQGQQKNHHFLLLLRAFLSFLDWFSIKPWTGGIQFSSISYIYLVYCPDLLLLAFIFIHKTF